MRKTTHVVPHHDGWAVKTGGSSRAYRVFDNKQEAVDVGRKVSINQESEFLIHGKNGRIQKADSHGGDPYPPKDKK